MRAQFGLVLPAGPPKGAPEEWLEGMESLLPDLGEQVTGLWMTDHFFWDDLPTFEVWTVLSYAAAPRYFLTLRRGRNRCEKANDGCTRTRVRGSQVVTSFQIVRTRSSPQSLISIRSVTGASVKGREGR